MTNICILLVKWKEHFEPGDCVGPGFCHQPYLLSSFLPLFGLYCICSCSKHLLIILLSKMLDMMGSKPNTSTHLPSSSLPFLPPLFPYPFSSPLCYFLNKPMLQYAARRKMSSKWKNQLNYIC